MITSRHAARAVGRSACSCWSGSDRCERQSAAQPGTLESASFHSSTLGEDIAYNVYLPAGYSSTAKRYPVLYLLHGAATR